MTVKAFHTLIKLAQKKLEDCQKQVAELQQELRRLDARSAMIQEQVEEGYKTAGDVDAPTAYQVAGTFVMRAEQEQQHIAEERQTVQAALDELREEMRILFAEKKRYEILEDAQKMAAKKAYEKKAQAALEDLTNR